MEFQSFQSFQWNAVLVVLVSSLAGCAAEPSRVDHTKISAPSPLLLERAAPLPEIPECDKFVKAVDRTRCRVAYDEQVRSAYVRLGARHDGLVDWAGSVVRK